VEFSSDLSDQELASLFDSPDYMDLVVAARKASMHGSNFVPDLLSLLDHEFYEIRGYAARSLARLGVSEAVPQILPLLDDDMEEVRFSAADALGYFQDDRIIRPLLLALADPSRETQRLAVIALSKQDSEALYQEIKSWVGAITDHDYSMDTEESIIRIDVSRGLMEAFSEFEFSWISEFLAFGLDNPDLEMVRLAAITVGRKQMQQFLPDLLALQDHADDDLRLAVVFSLTRLQFDGKLDLLLKYQQDSYEFIRQILATYLPLHHHISDISTVLEEFSQHEVSIVRSALASSLRSIEYLTYLERLLHDNNPYVRQEAARSLGQITASESLDILQEHEETDELVKVAVDNSIHKLQDNLDVSSA